MCTIIIVQLYNISQCSYYYYFYYYYYHLCANPKSVARRYTVRRARGETHYGTSPETHKIYYYSSSPPYVYIPLGIYLYIYTMVMYFSSADHTFTLYDSTPLHPCTKTIHYYYIYIRCFLSVIINRCACARC